MLFNIHPDKDVFDQNPGLRAVPAFNKLTDNQMKFVILVADPSRDNPLRTLSGRARRERAALLAGYKLEGKRLARNARELVYQNVDSVEEAIEEFKSNHYNESDRNREALRKQIAEIRDFLKSDKKIPVISSGKIVVDKHGNEQFTTDQKALKLAAELGVKLPELEAALKALESKEPEPKYEGTSYTASDIPEDMIEESAGELNAIELFMRNRQEKQ